jgi:hypothetical protein
VPGATTAADTATSPTPPDLYVNESIVRWAGWSLAAPRPGPQIDPSDQIHDNRGNPAVSTPDADGQITPQLSAAFNVVPGTLPKLRFGHRYRYRARAVDLAGNSLPVDTLDASTATPTTVHYRYEPVASPVLAQTAPLGPGEATLLLAIRNYQTAPATTVTPNGRWLFPPKASELLAEEHGMLDGFRRGLPPNTDRRPNPNLATYELLAGTGGNPGLVDATLANLPAVQFDTDNNDVPYFVPTDDPTTPWLPDPLSRGATLDGFPGALEPTVRPWRGGPWPGADPLLLMLDAGATVGHHYNAGGAGAPSTETVTLPPAAVLDLGISSALTSPATLGVWSWIEAQATTELEKIELAGLARRGQLWMLSPYRVVRLVHAVRLPLVGPRMADPVVSRQYGSVQASIVDTAFVLDAPSTADIDAEAVWVDRLDDPSDPTNDPATATVTSTGHAFKANVPDPGPLGAVDRPMEIFSPPTEFPILTDPGVTHNIGDTLHHIVGYTCTATSRFAEFFRTSTTVTLTGTTASTIATLGVDPATLVVESDGTELTQSADGGLTGDYQVVSAADGTIALLPGSSYSGLVLDVSYVPFDTVTGAIFPVEILSSAVPKAPKVVKVSPAWAIQRPTGSVEDPGGVLYARNGGYVRVYLERPWFSSGNGELLGVVGLDPSLQDGSVLPNAVSPSWVTLMGLDPISVSSLDQAYPVAPSQFSATATVPPVPYRPAYSSPPSVPLLENPGQPMQIWPYEVNYDPVSGYWYADVQISVGAAVDGPPPGYFLRLALVRFQPYAIVGAEVSTVTLATFAQPVADRFVTVTSDTSDPTNSSVYVSVSGPGYYGWRPPLPIGVSPGEHAETQVDDFNPYAPLVYEDEPDDTRSTSTMVVEVQVQDTSSGLAGDLAWVSAPGSTPVVLNQSFFGSNEVLWEYLNDGGGKASIPLPAAIGSATPMRLRVSELDYYQFRGGSDGPVIPATVDTGFRRPFVALIPIS